MVGFEGSTDKRCPLKGGRFDVRKVKDPSYFKVEFDDICDATREAHVGKRLRNEGLGINTPISQVENLSKTVDEFGLNLRKLPSNRVIISQRVKSFTLNFNLIVVEFESE